MKDAEPQYAPQATNPDTTVETVTAVEETATKAPTTRETSVPTEILARIVALTDFAVLPVLMRVSRVFSDLAAPPLYKNILVTIDDARNYPSRKSPFDGVNHIAPSQFSTSRERAALRHVRTMRIVPHRDWHDVQEEDTKDPDFLINRVTPDIELPRLGVIHSTQLTFCVPRRISSGGSHCRTVCPLLAQARPNAFINDPKDPDANWATPVDDSLRNRSVVPLPESIDTLVEVVYPDTPYESDPFDYDFGDDKNKHFRSRLLHTFDKLFPRHQPTVHIIFAPPPLNNREIHDALQNEQRHAWSSTVDFVRSVAEAGMQKVSFVGIEMLGPWLPERVRLSQDREAAIRDELQSMLRDLTAYPSLTPEAHAAGTTIKFESLETWERETMVDEWDLNEKVTQWKERARAQAIAGSQSQA